jgi:hypothetical protein
MDFVAALLLVVTAWITAFCAVISMCSLAGRADTLGEFLNEALADGPRRRALESELTL